MAVTDEQIEHTHTHSGTSMVVRINNVHAYIWLHLYIHECIYIRNDWRRAPQVHMMKSTINGNKMNGIIKTSKLKQWLCDNSGGCDVIHIHIPPKERRTENLSRHNTFNISALEMSLTKNNDGFARFNFLFTESTDECIWVYSTFHLHFPLKFDVKFAVKCRAKCAVLLYIFIISKTTGTWNDPLTHSGNNNLDFMPKILFPVYFTKTKHVRIRAVFVWFIFPSSLVWFYITHTVFVKANFRAFFDDPFFAFIQTLKKD